MKLPDIDTSRFFKIGQWVFILISILSLINLVWIYKTLNIIQICTSSIFIFFYFITALYFIFLAKQQVPMMTKEDLTNDKIIKDAMKLLDKERKKNQSEK